MDYDDNDFQNQNLHLAGEAANNKFPPVLQSHALPKFDFDDSLNTHLRFDSLVETEGFLGIEGNEDNNWIEDYSRGSSGIVFSSVASESCTISRHNNVWSEATSSESVEMLLNSVGQDEIIVRENSIKKSVTTDELGCTMEQMEPAQTNHEKSLSVEETVSLNPNPSVDVTLGESSVLETDAGHEQVLVKDDSPTVAQVLSMEENVAVLASDSATVEAVDAAGHDKLGEEEENAALASNSATVETVDMAGHDKAGEEEKNPVLASISATVEAVDSAGHDEINNDVLASNSAIVEVVDIAGHDNIGETVDAPDPMDSMVESAIGGLSEKSENNEGSAGEELAVIATDGDQESKSSQILSESIVSETVGGQDAKSSQILSESIVSETVGYVSGGPPSKLAESKSESDTISTDKSGTVNDGKDCEAFPFSPEALQHLSQDGTPVISLTSSIDLHMVKRSSDENEQGSFSETEKLSSSEPEKGQTVPSLDASSSGTQTNEEARKHTEDTQQSTRLFEGSPPIEGSKYSVDGQIHPPLDSGAQTDQQARKHAEDTQLSTQIFEGSPPAEGSNDSVDGQVVPPLDSGASTDQQATKHTEDTQQRTQTVEASPAPEGSKDAVDGQTVILLDPSSTGTAQQAKKHTEDTQPSKKFVESCPASEGSKDVVDSDATGQVLLQQPEKTTSEENLATDVVNAGGTQSIPPDTNVINEKPNTSFLFNIGSETGKDGREEDNTATSGEIMTAGSPVSHPKGDATKIGDSHASCSEPSHVMETENAAANVRTPLLSFPTAKSSELQVDTTETNSVKKPEDQDIPTSMSVDSAVLNTNETFGSGTNTTSDLQKSGEITQTVDIPQATLVSPIGVGSPSTSSLDKTAAKSSKTKSERKPRRTSKSAGKDTSRKGNSVQGATPLQHFQSGGKANAFGQSSGVSIQITQSTEKQQSLQTTALKALGTFSTPTASLPDLNSSSLSSILRRPFTDLQQVQLRAQIFVYGALIQGTAPDEAHMLSAFGGPDGEKGSWDKAWRACVIRAQKLHVANPETPLQSRAGKIETPSSGHTNRTASNPIIPLTSPLWSLSTSLDTLQPSSVQRGSAAGHQPLVSPSHAHQASPITNIVGHNTPWMSPLPYRNPWHAIPQTSGFDVGSRIPVFPITEPVKLTPIKEPSMPYPGAKHVQSGTSSNVFMGPPALEPTSTVVSPAQHSTGPKSRKRKKIPDTTVEPSPSILNSLKHAEFAASPLVSISTAMPNRTAPVNLASEAGTPNVVSNTAVPTNLLFGSSAKKMKSSFPSPIFGGNLVPDVKQRSILSEDTIDKLKEAEMHAKDASALAVAAVTHSEYIWKQIEQQRHAGLQEETESRLASAAVAIAAAAAVAKAAAAAANLAANAALQAKLMAEEASLQSISDQAKSILKSESPAANSNSVLIAAREASKKKVEAATAATKRAENMDSILKAAELASEAVSQAGILVSMGHPPLLNKLMEAGPSNYWRQAQESQEVPPSKFGKLEKETAATSDETFASPRTVQTELDGSVKTAVGIYDPVSATAKETKGLDSDMAKSDAPFDTQPESQQIPRSTNSNDINEGSSVEVFKEEPGLTTGWYSANVLSIENGRAYVLFSDLFAEQGTDKLKEWIALNGEGDEAPKIRSARFGTAMPYEGTRKRRRAAIGDPIWRIGDRVDSWVHDSWLEGVITEKNKKDENTLTVHFPAQGDTLTIKAWNLRPSLVWKDGRWTEYCSSGENVSSSHEGDTPKEKRPRLELPAPVAEGKDTSLKIVDNPDLGKPPQPGVLDFSVSENTFNIGRSTTDENKHNPVRMKRTGLQTQGSRVVFGVPKPGKKKKFMEVSKHYVSEASTKTRERKEPPKPVKPAVPHNSGTGSWRMPSKNISREKQTTISKPKTFKPAPKAKEKPIAPSRTLPRKDIRNTSASDVESDDATDQNAENKGPASGAAEEQTPSSSQDFKNSNTNKGKGAPAAGRLAKIEEDKALKTSDGTEPRRSVRRIQPTSRLLEGLQTSMMTSKIPSVSHSKSHQSQSRK